MREVDSEFGLEMWVASQATIGGWEWCVVQWGLGGIKDWEVSGQETDFIGASCNAKMALWQRQEELKK